MLTYHTLKTEMDDDVMDQQKYSASAMLLAKALVDAETQATSVPPLPQIPPTSPSTSSTLPEIPLHAARQIMTRADFIQSYDHINVFTIDSRAMVRADSVPMQNAFREICALDGFQEHLESTLQRIADIESLGRTRELVAKDLVTGGVSYVVSSGSGSGSRSGSSGREGDIKLRIGVENVEKS
jgi:hypothetical protein